MWHVSCKSTAWCSEIGSLWLLDAPELHASSDVREPISLHQAVHEDYMHLHCGNFSLDTAAFTKPVDFKVEPLLLVARNRKI